VRVVQIDTENGREIRQPVVRGKFAFEDMP